MADDKELRETVRAAFACYDEDGSGWIDAAELRHLVSDLGGVLTERDFRKALQILDRDSNGVIDRDEFTEWWVGQSEGNGTAGEVEKVLARLRDLGRQRFHVDIHTACWNGFEDVVERLVEDGSELVNQRDSSEYGNQNSPLHYAAYQGHNSICDILIKQGASINGTNGSGCTPVFFASQQGHVGVVDLLLQNGAELRIAETKNGLTPVDVCTTPAITELFRNLLGKPPSTPAAPTLEPLSDTELKILWSPPRPNLDEVVPVSGYKVKISSSSVPVKIALAVAFPTETSISGLCADTEYSASICAISLHGLSEFSAESELVRTRKAKPLAPVLCVTDTGPAEISVAWTLADSDRQPGVSCIIYLTSPEPDGTCKWESVLKTDDHAINSTTVEDLLPDHRYKLRAVVISDDGQQALSDAVAARTTGKAAAKRSTSSKFLGASNVVRAFSANRKEAKDNQEAKP
ncbi:hypothetical protein F441_12049 [Phytophthora nicotianae CJ01A1]|uniref:Uncharacterized protein n=3 Tax=Phytophthora nicotianae TaxID=4792 RepID=V9EWM0_PHYNI|nr:hypothetical protein F443_12085 [Phytophthora nicotianae P1569]ETK82901.1 hypothetical protein L915_11795 [Phytophthora nicotianae]ETL36280.1 hypothetical protein L916_11721 [Phytophthora nicotianae]ETM42777.1 hypothetical protein L914_11632 [Phytophthora nicotianae]ETP12608.1 hypothetical protein F441_12049 [Phytophthora nicotianae CJ01A1]